MRMEETKAENAGEFSASDDALRCSNLKELYGRVREVFMILNETTTKQFLSVRESKR